MQITKSPPMTPMPCASAVIPRTAGMSDTRALLNRIAAIRNRLGQAQGMLLEAHTEAIDLVTPNSAGKTERLEAKVAGANRVQTLLDNSLRQITGVFDGAGNVRPTLL